MPTKNGNAFMAMMIKSPFYWMLGKGFAVITLNGRKSGKPISTPVNVFRMGEGWVILSSRERTWWRNLRGGVDALLHTDGKEVKVKGEVFEEPQQVMTHFTEMTKSFPIVARYSKVRVDNNGILNQNDLQKISVERVVVQLHPFA